MFSEFEEEKLWETMETNPGPTCDNNPQIWLGISDNQDEYKHLNIANFSYRDIFLDTEIVGHELKETRWGFNQPGGGIIENCVATSRSGKWKDTICSKSKCTVCVLDINRQFKLRGFCKNTKFDIRFKMSVVPDNETGSLYFIGQFGWSLNKIKVKKENSNETVMGYGLYKPGELEPFAVYNDTDDYPMGYKKWVVNGKWDNCPTLSNYTLTFSSCGLGEFTCNDGSCISKYYNAPNGLYEKLCLTMILPLLFLVHYILYVDLFL